MGTKTQLPTYLYRDFRKLSSKSIPRYMGLYHKQHGPITNVETENTFGLSTQLFPYKDTDVYLKIDNPLFQLN